MSFSTNIARITAAIACSVFAVVSASAQFMPMSENDQSNLIESDKPSVRELVKNKAARFVVVNKSVESDVTRATVVLTNADGSTIGGYGSPYVESNDQLVAMWREFISSNLNISAQPDELTVVENRAAADATFAVAFVLDHSPSTTMPRAIRMQRAVQAALTQFAPQDFVSVIKFTGRINVEVPITKVKEDYISKFQVNGLNMRVSGSAVFDAAAKGLEELASTNTSRRLLILFTDGEDNSSSKKLQEVIALAKASNTQIHTVTYGVGDEEVLSRLALETSGRMHELHDVYDFDKVFLGIYASMRHSYDLTVRTHNAAQIASNISSAVISSSGAAQGTIQPMEVLSLMPKQGIQVTSPSTRSDQSLTMNVDLKFEGEASDISAADILMLDSIATVLVQRADLALEIVPASDGASVAPEAVVIAQRRATAVRDLLIRRGVHPSRVQGYASRPTSTPLPRGTSPKTTFVFTKM